MDADDAEFERFPVCVTRVSEEKISEKAWVSAAFVALADLAEEEVKFCGDVAGGRQYYARVTILREEALARQVELDRLRRGVVRVEALKDE
jgi:hypothetical protein